MDSECGGALLIALVAAFALAAIAASIAAVAGAREREQVAATEGARALYAAEAGLSEAVANARAGVVADWGSAGAPVAFGGGACWGTALDNGDDTFTLTSFASVGRATRGMQAVLVRNGQTPFTSALFAGNSSGDPLYDLKFGGSGAQADSITGNVYSGGNVVIDGTATVDGAIRALGSVTGGDPDASVATGASLPIPDVAAMDYAHTCDVNVATQFGSATYVTNPLGGKAWQVAESNPAHIFRKNPSDRSSQTSLTSKDDYFLEDPYESVSTSSTVSAANGTRITLSGHDGNPGTSGSGLVYYIDGNLWVHNLNIYSFTLYNSGAEAARATLVVSGNIYFSDNVIYQDPARYGLAFIAVEDPAEADSGNIYFGDPSFGTLERMDAFMYAENDFVDNNLSATGSARVTVNGNMTAGNQVRINRDFGTQHSKLTVNFDDRLASGALALAGIPGSDEEQGATWTVVGWREIAAH